MASLERSGCMHERSWLGNGYIRGLGAFMVVCSVLSLAQQYAFVNEKSLGESTNFRSTAAMDTIVLSVQKVDTTPDATDASDSYTSLAPSISAQLASNSTPTAVPTPTPALTQAIAEATNANYMLTSVAPSTLAPSTLARLASNSTPTTVPTPTPTLTQAVTNKPTEPTEKPKEKPTKQPVKPTKQPVKPKRVPEPPQTIKQGSKGILMCLHDGILELGISLIRELRCLGNTEPIEVHHCHDLTRPSVDLLYGLDDNIQVIDLCERYVIKKILSNELAKTFQSYWIKPLAVHFTSFEELIFLDADAVLLKNPAALRDNEGYKKHGTIFFYDRVINNNQYLNKRKEPNGPTYLRQWLKSFDYKRFGLAYADPSPALKNSFVYRGKSAHEQDSSMLLINKRHASKAMKVLWFLMTEHRFVYTFSWGDKEAFWLSYEFSHTPYFFSPWGASVVSDAPNKDVERHPATLCGSLAHFDPTLNASAPPELLYVNGRSLVHPIPFRLHKLKLLQPNLVFNMLPTHVTPRQKRRAPDGKGEWPECMTGMGSTLAPLHLLPNLWRRRQHFQAISMGYIEPLLECSDPGHRLPDIPPPRVKPPQK